MSSEETGLNSSLSPVITFIPQTVFSLCWESYSFVVILPFQHCKGMCTCSVLDWQLLYLRLNLSLVFLCSTWCDWAVSRWCRSVALSSLVCHFSLQQHIDTCFLGHANGNNPFSSDKDWQLYYWTMDCMELKYDERPTPVSVTDKIAFLQYLYSWRSFN